MFTTTSLSSGVNCTYSACTEGSIVTNTIQELAICTPNSNIHNKIEHLVKGCNILGPVLPKVLEVDGHQAIHDDGRELATLKGLHVEAEVEHVHQAQARMLMESPFYTSTYRWIGKHPPQVWPPNNSGAYTIEP